MKLLLTSGGLTNETLKTTFFELVNKKAEDITLSFVPTASNMEEGDKSWLIDELIILKGLNLKSIEITDISATTEKIWKASFQRADVIYFEGGETCHLMQWLDKTGLNNELKDIIKDKVFVGVSAGSMVTGPDLILKTYQDLFGEVITETEKLEGLNWTNFYIIPHLNSPHFPKVTEENIKKASEKFNKTIYGLDDDSAIKIIDGKMEIIGEGIWCLFENF